MESKIQENEEEYCDCGNKLITDEEKTEHICRRCI